jgi:hypothetical protein
MELAVREYHRWNPLTEAEPTGWVRETRSQRRRRYENGVTYEYMNVDDRGTRNE